MSKILLKGQSRDPIYEWKNFFQNIKMVNRRTLIHASLQEASWKRNLWFAVAERRSVSCMLLCEEEEEKKTASISFFFISHFLRWEGGIIQAFLTSLIFEF